MSVVQSGRLTFEDGPLAKSLTEATVALSLEKAFLPEACARVICQICTLMGREGVEKYLLEALKPIINVSPRQCTAAGLAIILHLEQQKLVKDITAALPLWVGIQTPILQVQLLNDLNFVFLQRALLRRNYLLFPVL